jgi:hypothetical protein
MHILNLFGANRPNKKHIAKKYSKQICRTQFNFACENNQITAIKLLAKELEVPVYPLVEHLIQIGAQEVKLYLQHEALKETLQRHLLKNHLGVYELNPVTEPVSQRMQQLQKALDILEVLGEMANPKEVSNVLLQAYRQAVEKSLIPS